MQVKDKPGILRKGKLHISDHEFKLIANLVYDHFGIHLSETKLELVAGRLNKLLKSGQDTLAIKVKALETGTMTSSKGNTFLAVTIWYQELGSDELLDKTRPIFTDEANMLINHGPFDPDATYIVTLGYKQGYPIWKRIEALIEDTAA